MQEVSCRKCGYTWQTKSTARRISCSKCKTSITLSIKSNTISPILRLPLKVVESAAFSKIRLWAKSNGEQYLELRGDKDGVLSLA